MAFKFNPFTGTFDEVGVGGGAGTPGGSNSQVQFNDSGNFGGDSGLSFNKTSNKLTTGGDIELNDGSSLSTRLQAITPTTNRVVLIPDANGIIGLVAGSTGSIVYNLNGAYAGSSVTFDAANGTRHVLPFGYGTGAGGTVTQATSKSTGVTLNTRCGQITMNGALLATGTAVSFTLTNSEIAATDVLLINNSGVGTLGAYLFGARCAAGSATITIRNLTAGDLSEAIVINFILIKASTT